MGSLTDLLSKIQPAVYEENQTQDPATRNSHNSAFVENVSDLNVRRSVKTIVNRSLILEQLIEDGKLAVIGAKHDLATGRVQFFEDTWMADRESLLAVARADRKPVAAKAASPRPATSRERSAVIPNGKAGSDTQVVQA